MKAILTYHSIDDSGSPISIDAPAFRRHIAWLASGAVRVVSIDALMALPADADAVALTFDDGFVNFADVAAPLLVEHRLPATLFVVTGHVGGTNAWRGSCAAGIPTMPLLDWSTLGSLAEEGITIGAHTRTHPNLATLDPSQLADEIGGSADDLERELGRRPSLFAYPYGAVPGAAARAAAQYRWAVTTEMRPLEPAERPECLPRLDAYYFRSNDLLEAWGTMRFRRFLWVRSNARRVRAALSAAAE